MQLYQKTFFLVLFSILLSPLLFAQNVGIGITTPLQKLHVDGTARLNSLAGSGNRMVIANSNGDLATQAIPGGAISSITAGAGLSGGGNSGTIVLNAMADNGLNVNPAADRIQLGGPLTQTTTISLGAFTYTHNLTAGGNFLIQDNGTTRFAVLNNGRVAVGSTANVATFNVTGNSYFSDDIYLRDGALTGVPLLRLYDSSDDGVIDMFQGGSTIANRLHGNGNSFINGGNLGLGTTAPGQKLHVIGTGRFSNLAGVGTRMVVANANGDLATQGIPIGDVTGVTAGAGLVGGGTAGALTLVAVANNGLSVDAVQDRIQLGGALTKNTDLTFNGNDLRFEVNGGGFLVHNSGTTEFAVSPFGGVGIGTTTMEGAFNVKGDSYLTDDLVLRDGHVIIGDDLVRLTNDNDDGVIQVYQNDIVVNQIHGNGDTYFTGGNFGIGTNNPAYSVHVKSDARYGALIQNDAKPTGNYSGTFIKAQGQVGSAGNAIGSEIYSNGDANVTGVYTSAFVRAGSGYAYGIHASFANQGSGVEYAGYFDGNVFSTGAYLPSFRALKQNIQLASPAISKLMALKVKSYEYRIAHFKSMNLPVGEQVGFMADEIKEIYPGLVKKTVHPKNQDDPDSKDFEFDAVNYTGLIPDLVKGTQEQQDEIEALKKEIKDLKSVVAQMADLIKEK